MAESIGLTTPYDQILASNLISAKRSYFINIQGYYLAGGTGSYSDPILLNTTTIDSFTSGICIIQLYDNEGSTSGRNENAYVSVNPVIIIPNMDIFAISVTDGRSDHQNQSTNGTNSGNIYGSLIFKTTGNQFLVYGFAFNTAYIWLHMIILIIN